MTTFATAPTGLPPAGPTELPPAGPTELPPAGPTGLSGAAVLSARIREFLDEPGRGTPFLVVDLDVVEDRFRELRAALPPAAIYYAVKANPARDIVRRLVRLGSNFDIASPAELDICLTVGAEPHRISYGHTVKKASDIAYAYSRGVRQFAFDSHAELEKIAQFAPRSAVVCRLLVDNSGAQWPLSGKFGCSAGMAATLLVDAVRLGLDPLGLSFHVGSQQLDPRQWQDGIDVAAGIFAKLARVGISLRMLNLGGGFPAQYRDQIPPLVGYGRAIDTSLRRSFGGGAPAVAVEPGRFLVGDAGVVCAEVVLVSRKSFADSTRWVYLDVGRFGGLAETEGEAIKYRIITPHDGRPVGPTIIAGPTCDSVDVLYGKGTYRLPLELRAGDRIVLLSAGAYTATYASVGFNGFDPLPTYCIAG